MAQKAREILKGGLWHKRAVDRLTKCDYVLVYGNLLEL